MTPRTISNRKAERDDRGASAVEYSMLSALIAAVIVAIVATLGADVQAMFQTVVDLYPLG